MKHLPAAVVLLLSSANPASAIDSAAAKVVSGISNCTVTKTGSNSWKAGFSLNWLAMPSTAPVARWGSRTGRGFLIFQYDSSGKAIKTFLPATDISMNGYSPAGNNTGGFTSGNGYLTYGRFASNGWTSVDPYSANLVFEVKSANTAIVAMYPTNVYNSGIALDQAGAVYFSNSQATSHCQMMANPNTPPVIVNLTMNAPDWNLGEIATGKQQKVLTSSADRLCISYLSTESKGKDFIVNATSANGIVNNRFALKHSLKPSNNLPYTLTLDSAGSQLLLPNIKNSTLKFDSSGNETCFTPTFDLYGSDSQELGDYTDVITYEIVTKS